MLNRPQVPLFYSHIVYITPVIYPIFDHEMDRFLPFYAATRYCPIVQWSVLSYVKIFIIC